MPISLRNGIFAITLALTILISSSVLPNNSNYFVVNALSKKDFLYATSSSHNSDGFFYKMVDGHTNRCYNKYKLASIVCTREDGTSNGNSSSSSLRSSTFYLRNYNQVTPSNIDGGKNSDNDNYTYTSGLASSPLILPVDNTHTTSNSLSTNSNGGIANSFSSPSRQIDTKDIADNAITEAKLSRDAVHIVWDDNSPDSEMLYRTNAGDVFARSADNLSHNAAVSFQPAIAVSGNNIYVVWSDNTPGRTDIFYTRSMDGGATFGGNINLSNTTGSSGSPAIAISANNVYVAWSDNTGTGEDSEILYRRSTDGGATFGSTFNLSNTAGVSRNPSVAVADNNVYLVWNDNTSGNGDILLRKSVNAGATFGSTINVSQNAGFSELPAIAVSTPEA